VAVVIEGAEEEEPVKTLKVLDSVVDVMMSGALDMICGIANGLRA
jgi:hypothetical protein